MKGAVFLIVAVVAAYLSLWAVWILSAETEPDFDRSVHQDSGKE